MKDFGVLINFNYLFLFIFTEKVWPTYVCSMHQRKIGQIGGSERKAVKTYG